MGEISMSGSTREGGAAVIGLRASHPVLSPLLYWLVTRGFGESPGPRMRVPAEAGRTAKNGYVVCQPLAPENRRDARGPRPEPDSSRRARSRSPSLEKEGTRAWSRRVPSPSVSWGTSTCRRRRPNSRPRGMATRSGRSIRDDGGGSARWGGARDERASWMELVDASLPEG